MNGNLQPSACDQLPFYLFSLNVCLISDTWGSRLNRRAESPVSRLQNTVFQNSYIRFNSLPDLPEVNKFISGMTSRAIAGPALREGEGINAWSEVVGEP